MSEAERTGPCSPEESHTGMLRRTRYSRLRNDSLASLEDRPQRILSLKRDLCLDSDFALLDPGTPDRRVGSTLRSFVPHAGTAGPQSVPVGQTTREQRKGTDWDRRPCNPPSPAEPLSGGLSALSGTKRPITLHRMTSLPSRLGCSCSQHRDGLGCPQAVPGAGGSVHHDIKYLGNVEVTKSMRTLDSDTRMQLTREAISRLCERTTAKAAAKTKRLSAVLGGAHLQFSGVRVILTVSTDSLTLIAASSLQKIARHPMQTISFASGGDPEMADYIAYVAKDIFNLRACHILECPRGQASEVIDSIGRAFENRFHRLLSHTPALLSPNTRSAVRTCHKRPPEETNPDQKADLEAEVGRSPDYYNLTPDKAPPVGRLEQLQLRGDKNRLRVGAQKVPLYENCPAERATPADSGESRAAAEELIQDQGWFQGRLGRHGVGALLTCAGDQEVSWLGGPGGTKAHRH